MKSVFEQSKQLQEINFGHIKLKLKEYLDTHNYTRNQLSVNTGIKYQTIDRYYKNINIDRVDLQLLAKMCYVLDCELSDIMEYISPER